MVVLSLLDASFLFFNRHQFSSYLCCSIQTTSLKRDIFGCQLPFVLYGYDDKCKETQLYYKLCAARKPKQ